MVQPAGTYSPAFINLSSQGHQYLETVHRGGGLVPFTCVGFFNEWMGVLGPLDPPPPRGKHQ